MSIKLRNPNWNPDIHRHGGRLWHDPNTNVIRVIDYVDNKTDCLVCGPRLRSDLLELINQGFLDRQMHLSVIPDPGQDTIRKQIVRKGGHGFNLPLLDGERRAVLSDIPIGTHGRRELSMPLPDSSRRLVLDLVLARWAKSRNRRTTTIPRGWRAEVTAELKPWTVEGRPKTVHLPLVDLGTIAAPTRLVEELAGDGIHFRLPGESSELHVHWCNDRFQQLLRQHNHRPSTNEIPQQLLPGHPDRDRHNRRYA